MRQARRMPVALVQGNFEVSGGSGNDIQVVIGPRAEVLNWLNGHEGSVTYASEKTTAGTVNVKVGEPGDYLLAFSNVFSTLSAKNVQADMRLVQNGTE